MLCSRRREAKTDEPANRGDRYRYRDPSRFKLASKERPTPSSLHGWAGLCADLIVPELYSLRTPASPHHSAEIEGVRIDTDSLKIPNTRDRPLVIEGAGGLMVPLTCGTVYIDIFGRWQLPVVLWASLNSAPSITRCSRWKLCVSAKSASLGLHSSAKENSETESAICEIGRVRWLGRLPWLIPLTPEAVQVAFKSSFVRDDFLNP
nr:AAA family ATPase [Bradyrhizobium sp. 169]